MKLLVILQKQLVLWGILQRTELDVIQKSDNNPTLRETKSKAVRHGHTVRVNQHPPAHHVGCMVFEQGTPLFHCIPVHIANHGDQLYSDWCWPDIYVFLSDYQSTCTLPEHLWRHIQTLYHFHYPALSITGKYTWRVITLSYSHPNGSTSYVFVSPG